MCIEHKEKAEQAKKDYDAAGQGTLERNEAKGKLLDVLKDWETCFNERATKISWSNSKWHEVEAAGLREEKAAIESIKQEVMLNAE